MPNTAQQKLIFEKLNYIPNEQQQPIHDCPARFKLVAGGERSGKSFLSAMEYMGNFWEYPLAWLVGADYSQTKAEFDYICQAFEKLNVPIDYTKQVDPGEIRVQGGFVIYTKSAKDPRKLGREAPDFIIVCEAAQCDYETFLRMRGRVAEKRGRVLLSGCLHGDTLIPTNTGLCYISEVVGSSTKPLTLLSILFLEMETPLWAFIMEQQKPLGLLVIKGFK